MVLIVPPSHADKQTDCLYQTNQSMELIIFQILSIRLKLLGSDHLFESNLLNDEQTSESFRFLSQTIKQNKLLIKNVCSWKQPCRNPHRPAARQRRSRRIRRNQKRRNNPRPAIRSRRYDEPLHQKRHRMERSRSKAQSRPIVSEGEGDIVHCHSADAEACTDVSEDSALEKARGCASRGCWSCGGPGGCYFEKGK